MTGAQQPETENRPHHNRRVIHATCSRHGGPLGFTNLVVSKRDGQIELDPHADGSCVLTQSKNSLGRSRLPSIRYRIESATIPTPKGDAITGRWQVDILVDRRYERNFDTRSACSRMTLALSACAVPAGSPWILIVGFDHTARRGQPPQLDL